MIRRFHNKDLNMIMEIWLESNIQAHSFLPKGYWEGHFTMVKELLPKAEVFVYEREGKAAVYEENQRGVNFYKREGFHLEKIQVEKETGKVEYEMKWIKNPVK